MSEGGAFREDLFYRLNVVPIIVPPLRKRVSDLPLIADFLLDQAADELGCKRKKISKRALEALKEHSWPGNVRELKNLAERIAVMCDDELIGKDMIAGLLHRRKEPGEGQDPEKLDPPDQGGLPDQILALPYAEARDLFEKQYLQYKLTQNGYIISRTAEAIGMYPSNLHAKLRKHLIRTER
jgi:two-component system nitrogen regulation response regulator NtrX